MDSSLPKPQGFLTKKGEIFERQTINMIYGPGGAYKTWFAIFMAGQLGLGIPIANIQTTQCRVLLISQEMTPPQFRKRVAALFTPEQAKMIGDNVAFRFQCNLDFFARTEVSQDRLYDIIEKTNKPDIVITDALVGCHHGNENSNQDMGLVLGTIKDVGVDTNTCQIIIHHEGKPNEFQSSLDRPRGASVMRDICADMAKIAPTKSQSNRARSKFSFIKTRDLSEPVNPFAFSFEPNPYVPDGVIFTYDFNVDEPDDTMIARLRAIVVELAGDGEVLKEALYLRMLEQENWGRRKLDEAIAHAVKIGVITRRMRGREASFFAS